MKKYWLTLNPDTFLWANNGKCCIYNTQNHLLETFGNTEYLQNILEKLLDTESLYSTELNEEVLLLPEVSAFVDKILSTSSGILTENNGNNKKPVSLKPILKLQDGVGYYEWEHRQGIDGDIIKNLHELVFYVNGSKYGNEWYHKQVIFPRKTGKTIDLHSLYRFALNARNPYLSQISLVGNLLILPEAIEIISKLEKISEVKVFITMQDAMDNLIEAEKLAGLNCLVILVTDYEMLELLFTSVSWAKNVSYKFMVTSESEYERAYHCADYHKLENHEIIPVYTPENHLFFEDNLYMDDEILSNIALSKKDIFIRQTLNIHHFGKLYILPDGNVYGNLNDCFIGNINEPAKDVVYREMTEGNSWLQIRNIQPCSNCVYQWLCPSPSNYEKVIGKMNLCNIL